MPLDKLDKRISAVLCVRYPPGTPVVVPGERFDPEVHPVVDGLTCSTARSSQTAARYCRAAVALEMDRNMSE